MMSLRLRLNKFKITSLLGAIVILSQFACTSTRVDSGSYQDLLETSKSQNPSYQPGSLKITFLGVSTLLFDDGETKWMTDGFFSRPGLLKVMLGSVAPNQEVVSAALAKAGVSTLSAVLPIHSHYDHALDSAFVAQQTGAILYGSASTANIGKGQGLSAEKIRLVKNGDVIQLGRFKVTVIESRHSPHAWYEGFIEEPLIPPQRASHYKMAECYSLLVEHEGKKILVHGSAGFIPGGLKGYKADVIYLGVGTLGRQDAKFQQDYWSEVVKTVGAKRVVLVHWDDFFEPLSEPLTPLAWPMDDFKSTLSFIRKKGIEDQVDIRMPVLWNVADPFKDLSIAK